MTIKRPVKIVYEEADISGRIAPFLYEADDRHVATPHRNSEEWLRDLEASINLAPRMAASLRKALYSTAEAEEMHREVMEAEALLAEWDAATLSSPKESRS